MTCVRREAGAPAPAASSRSRPPSPPQKRLRPDPRSGRRRARLFVFLPVVALLLGALGLFAAAPAQAQTTVWSATLTVDKDDAEYGCSNTSGGLDNCSTALSEDQFTHAGTTYTVDNIFWAADSNELWLNIASLTGSATKTALDGLTLNAAGSALAVSSANTFGNVVYWNYDPATDWTDGGTVSLSLTAPDTTGPSVSSVAVSSSPPAGQGGYYKAGDAVAATVTFDEAIVVTGTPKLEITVGTAAKSASCARKGSTGEDAKKLVCTYTVASGDADADGVSVAANKLTLPSGAAIKDAADNDATRTHAALAAQSGHKVDAVAPAAPRSLAATAGVGKVRLTWSDPSPADATIAKWQYRQKTTGSYGSWQDVSGGASARAIDVTGLPTTAHTFQVRAVDAATNAGASATAGPVTPTGKPAKPTGLTATAGNKRVALSWTDPSDSSITKYQVRQKAGSAEWGSWTDIPSSGATTTSYTVTGLANGTAYRFRIRAVNAGGEGPQSAVAGPATPAPGTGPAVAAIAVASSPPSNGWYNLGKTIAVEVTFDKAVEVTGAPELKIRVGSGSGSEKTASCARKGATGDDRKALTCSYTVASGDEDTDGVSVERNKLSLPSDAAIKDGEDNDATLTYAASLALAAQSGHKVDGKPPSLTVGDLTPSGPAQSKSIAVTATDSGSGLHTALNSYWVADASTTCDLASYEAASVSVTPANQLKSFASGTPVTLGSETNNGQYRCFAAIDNASNASYAKSAQITGIDTTDPGIAWPTSWAPKTGVAGTIVLTDSNAKIAKYGAIPVAGTSTDATACDTAAEIGSGNLTTLATPSASVDFAYTPPADSVGRKVCAYAEDAAGNSHAALYGTAIAQGAPAQPTGLRATAGNAQVTLNWTDPNDSTITKYQVAYKKKSASGDASFADITGSGATTTSHTVTGLDNGDVYQFWLRAVNGGGNGTHAGPVEATPTDNAGPAVTAIAVASSPPSTGWYKTGNAIAVEVTFDEVLAVTGSPELKIRVGSGSGSEKTATCARKGSTGDDRKALTCSYTVASGDEDTDGVSVERNKLSLPSGAAIKDVSDNAATLTYAASLALAAQSGHKVDGKPPSLTVGTPTPAGPAQSKSVSVTLTDSGSGVRTAANARWFLDASTTCDSASYLAAVTAGKPIGTFTSGTPVTLSSETNNGQYVCFNGTDNALNVTFAKSAEITGIDTTDPGIAWPTSWAPTTGVSGTIVLTDSNAKIAKYGAIPVVGTSTDATGCDTAAEIGSGNLTTLSTPSASVDFAYTPPADSATKKVCAYAEDAAGNSHALLYGTAIAAGDSTAPTVTSGSTGYYGEAGATTTLTGPLKSGADIYTKVTFSEDMKHVKSDAAAARPELFRRIGTTDTRYHVLDSGDTLASGDCKPEDSTSTDVYICFYTVGSSDSGAFTVKAGTNSVDKADNALAAVYTHAATNIYTKVTFSEDMKHVKSDAAAARPELFRRIGTTDTQYHVLDSGDTLASGDCGRRTRRAPTSTSASTRWGPRTAARSR